MDQFIKATLKVTAVLSGIVLLIPLFSGRLPWCAGFLLADIWASANFLLTLNLFKLVLLEKPKSGLRLLLLIKFPLLYLAGFWCWS